MRNLSALTVDPRTGHLLALSADSHLLLELDEKGEQVSFMTLLEWLQWLERHYPACRRRDHGRERHAVYGQRSRTCSIASRSSAVSSITSDFSLSAA